MDIMSKLGKIRESMDEKLLEEMNKPMDEFDHLAHKIELMDAEIDQLKKKMATLVSLLQDFMELESSTIVKILEKLAKND